MLRPPSDANSPGSGPPRVAVAVCGIFHYRKYIGELARHGCVQQFIYSHRVSTTAKSLGLERGQATNLWLKEYLYRSAMSFTRGGLRNTIDDFSHQVWDAGVARRLGACDIFHGMVHGSLVESFQRARTLGLVALGEPVNSHPAVLQEIVEAEHEVLRIPPPAAPRNANGILAELPLCDFLVVGSRLIRDSYTSQGFPAERIFVIPYAIDSQRFRPLSPKEKLTTRDKRFRVICVAQIVPRKGIHYLLEAWSRLGLSPTEAELVLVGQASPGMEGVLRKYAGQFTHIQSVPHDRLRLEYGRADVFVLPSVEDGFGYVVTEAMGCGLPVITTSAAGAADVVQDGISGFVVPPRSAEALADRLDRLRADQSLRESMGQANLRAAQAARTWSTYANELAGLYSHLMRSRPRGQSA